MKKLIMTTIGLVAGIFVIPALFAFAIAIGGTVIGFLAEPRVMLILLGILGIISIPGIIVGLFLKR